MNAAELVDDLASCLYDAEWDARARPGNLMALLDSIPCLKPYWRRRARKMLAGIIAAQLWRTA